MPGINPGVGDILQMRNVWYTPTQIGMNVLHYVVSARTGAGATLAELANSMAPAFQAPAKAIISAAARYRGVGFTNISAPRTLEYANTGSDIQGTGGATLAPTQSSLVIHWGTQMAGRKFRGRSYLPFPSTGDMNADGTPTTSYISRCTTMMATYATWGPVTGAGGTTSVVLVIYHRVGGGFDQVVLGTNTQKFGTQRRRGMYGRLNSVPW